MNNVLNKLRNVYAITIVSLLIGACASGPVRVVYQANGTRNLNPDENGRPLSLVLHIVQLKSNQSFSRLTSADLVSGKSEKDLLASELIDATELVLLPGGKSNINATIAPEARYIGVIGDFRQPDPYFWRLLFDADAVRSDGLSLQADRCFLRPLQPAKTDIPGQPKHFRPDCPR